MTIFPVISILRVTCPVIWGQHCTCAWQSFVIELTMHRPTCPCRACPVKIIMVWAWLSVLSSNTLYIAKRFRNLLTVCYYRPVVTMHDLIHDTWYSLSLYPPSPQTVQYPTTTITTTFLKLSMKLWQISSWHKQSFFSMYTQTYCTTCWGTKCLY